MKTDRKRSESCAWTYSSHHAYLLAFVLIGCSGHPKEQPPPRPDAGIDASAPPDEPTDAAVSPAPDMSVAPDMTVAMSCDAPPHTPSGRWTTGDLHVHTIESDDAQIALATVLDSGLAKYDLDWIALSNHLRLSSRDDAGTTIAGGPIPMSRGVAVYEEPAITGMEARGLYVGKTVFSTVEWDMPTHDHFNVGIVSPAPQSADSMHALNEFEYRFTNRDVSLFDPADVALWGSDRAYTTHEDVLKALSWLRDHYPNTSYGTINHPFRYPDRYTIADFRQFNDLAPNVFFAIEGMVGNQMEPDRGGYASPYTDANAHARLYGGVDATVSRLGGIWDALLGEGRRIWNVGNSDFHFKTASGIYSSGYFPGEYTKNYVWVDGEGMPAILAGLRAGKAFTVYGNLISALDFEISACAISPAEMGGELRVPKDAKIRVTIRWKSELPSNYETPVGSGNVPAAIPLLDHVDLIVGDVTGKTQPGTPEYANATNASTHVVQRFSAAAATKDAQGYSVVTYEVAATKNQYFRLRGTNLGVDVAGETQNGEPLADTKTDVADAQARFNAINDRNYADLWFYSNPIFVTVD